MNISLREIRESDLEKIMQWRMSPDITRFMNTDPKLTLEKQKSWLSQIRTSENVIHWLIEIDGKPAGTINLADIDWKNGTSSWGYYIGEKSLRSFQAALSLEMSMYDYVFDTLHFTEIHNEVLSFNASVVKLHEFCGNKIVKIVKGEVQKNGESYDVTHMSITRDEWFRVREGKKYQRINFDIELHLHHIGYAVNDIENSIKVLSGGGTLKNLR